MNYQGFHVTWNDTLAGDTVQAPCMGPGFNGQSCIYSALHTIFVTVPLYTRLAL